VLSAYNGSDMPETSSSSFIPKRKSAGSTRQVTRRNIYIFSIISYALFIAAPFASAAVFIYQKYTDNTFNQAVVDLDTAIKGFNETDLLRVIDFNERLDIGNRLLQSHVSLVSLLNILEQSTAKTIQFNSLKITRTDQSSLLVDAEIVADTFDALLFQRGLYENNNNIASSTYETLTFVPITADAKDSDANKPPLSLTAKMSFTSDSVLYTPIISESLNIIPDPLIIETAPATSTTTTSNQISI